MTEDLFPEFQPATKADWIAQAAREIKGQDVLNLLGSKLWDTVFVSPYYSAEDLDLPVIQHRFHPETEVPGLPPRVWGNLVHVYPGDSNAQILKVLENGAEGIILHLHGYEDLKDLLAGVLPQYISILIYPVGNPVLALKAFFEWTDGIGAPPESIQGGLWWTPSDLVFDQNESFGLGIEILSELLEMAESYPGFKPFCIKTSRYTESGGSPIEALSYGLGELIEWIDTLGEDPKVIFSNLFLEASISENYFGEIARMKAFRVGLSQISSLYSLDLKEEDVLLFCKTSQWSKSLLDGNTNLIRQTYEAMAAVLGGANWLSVEPMQGENSSEHDRRIARNVSTILRDESHLDKVMDSSAGSYFLENLTLEIGEILKNQLVKLEEKGGWTKALEAGEIHQSVRQQRAKLQNQVLQNQISKIGVNKYSTPDNHQLNPNWEHFEEKMFELKPTRASYLIELQTLAQP